MAKGVLREGRPSGACEHVESLGSFHIQDVDNSLDGLLEDLSQEGVGIASCWDGDNPSAVGGADPAFLCRWATFSSWTSSSARISPLTLYQNLPKNWIGLQDLEG